MSSPRHPACSSPRCRRSHCASLARAAAIAAGLLLASSALAADAGAPDPDASGAVLAKTVCASCHGPNGNAPPGEVPNLAGQKAGFLRRQLHAFKSHARSSEAAASNMWPVAHGLTERQVDELVALFSAQRPQEQPVEGTQERIAAGQGIFARGSAARGVPSCSGCHGAEGNGRGDTPRLAGQHVDYLVRQLRAFQRSNDRPAATAMRSFAHELTPDEIADVAAYLQALPSVGAR